MGRVSIDIAALATFVGLVACGSRNGSDASNAGDAETHVIDSAAGEATSAEAAGASGTADSADAMDAGGGTFGDGTTDAGGNARDAGPDTLPTDGGTADDGVSIDASSADGGTGAAPIGSIVTSLDVADVWSGDPVGFALVTRGNQQFVAFYDANRQMTVGVRSLDGTAWRLVKLASTVGWDSHNSIAMAIDSSGFIHVSGNMHAVPLVYFRTTTPLDIGTFRALNTMVGTNESSVTYPQFINGPNGEFIYAYRDGVSGNGNYIFDVFDVATQKWSRLINTPLTDGQGLRNAYPVGPILGPDGWWHLVYVWRETPDASTNHDLSYARSQDLVHWQSGAGKALTLPITLGTSDIVDPVPQNGGIINGNTKVGFDAEMRPVVAYQKFDATGNTQIYNARIESGKWVTRRASNWSYRWVIGGSGTLAFQIRLDGVKVNAAGALVQVWYHAQYGGWNAFQLDDGLTPIATLGRTLPYPASLDVVQSTTPGMTVRWANDFGTSPDPTVLYMLRWETLPENNDQPRTTIPPATPLRLYGFRASP